MLSRLTHTRTNKWLIRVVVVSCACVVSWRGVLAQPQRQTEITKYTTAAQRAMAAKNLPAAQIALQKLSTLTPDVAQVHAKLGLVLYMQNRYTQAIGAFDKAEKLDSALTNVKVLLGLCFAETGRNQDAIKLRPVCVSLMPSN